MRNQRDTFRRLPVARKLLTIVAVFVAIVLCVFYLDIFRSVVLSGVRAYVGGEGLWSKAEKRAALSLTDYAESHAEADYQTYLSEIAVPLGDKQARLQLQSSKPDMPLVYRGFVQGRIAADDVDSMAMLFRRFGRIGYMAHAIKVWTEGDAYIDQMRMLAEQLHAEINAAHPDARKIQQISAEVIAIDAQVTPLEDEFSATLSEGARWINHVLSAVIVTATGLLLLFGIGLSAGVLKQIRNSEEKYRNLINTANDAILVIDAQTRQILEANDRAAEMMGIPGEKLVGMAESSLCPATAGEAPAYLLSSNDRRGRELELRREDGSFVPVEVSVSTTDMGGRPALIGIFRDIRDRLEAAAVLRRSEDRFRYLIQNLSDVITVVAVDGTMLYHSPSIERVAGYTLADLLGHSILDFIHPEDSPFVRSALERVTLNVGSVAPPEFRFRCKDGSWVWLEAVVNNLLNDVAVGGIVVTSRDVSGRRVLEEQVRQSQKMEAVGRLAGGIAHDFNNLLMVIRGYGEIALQETLSNPTLRKSIETIVRTTESAASLTRQLLSFSRKHVFSPQVLDLNSLVEEMSEMLLGVLREEMQFAVELDPGTGCISADPGQIEQVIMNLVVNARDAMPRGGKLTLETAAVEVTSKENLSSFLPPGSYVVLSVSDSGIGMDAETRSHIFEPFFTTKSKEEGTGLGLSVVYNIVRGIGGHVRVNSEPGCGSIFQVFLPRVLAAPQPRTAGGRSSASRIGTETILVAEDQPELRWMICQYLQALGYAVLEAKDGDDALALAEQYKGSIDVLLTDIVMPNLRGPEVARRLAASRPEVQVIFMSGYTEGALELASTETLASSNVLLQKPFELKFLHEKIREVLQARTHR